MQHTLLNQFKQLYLDFKRADLSDLDQIYAENVVFKDPVHELQGLTSVQDYMARLGADVEACRFEYLDELIGDSSAYIKWIMHFSHPRLGRHPIRVRGASHLQFSAGRIVFHEDFYDMGAMLYEQLPLLGAVTRCLKRRLA